MDGVVMKFIGLVALVIFSAAGFSLSAQPVTTSPPTVRRAGEPVAAIVNDDVITQRDVDLRMKLALYNANLADTPDMRSRLLAPLLQRMIDEDLKIQAAAQQKIIVSPEDIKAQIEALELQNHLPPGGLVKLLASQGIEIDALRQQIRAEIAWSGLVRHVLAREVRVSESAVTTRLDAIRANLGKPEYHVAEITLGVDDPKNEGKVRDLAERLTEQVRKGAPFGAIAQQFSQAGAPDGNLGWVSEGMLDDEFIAALDNLAPHGVTPPIRTSDGYHILTLLEKRKVGEGMGSGPTVDLMMIELNSLPSAKSAERDLQMQHLRQILAPARNCDDLTELSRQVPSATITVTKKLPETEIPTRVAPLIKDLSPGQLSEPIDAPKGRRFYAVCERSQGNSEQLPTADEIRHRMEEEQLELVVRRHLLTLRRGAFIDIRL
jgi:peptidyl-prolyl cis-trans isomerase SurA